MRSYRSIRQIIPEDERKLTAACEIMSNTIRLHPGFLLSSGVFMIEQAGSGAAQTDDGSSGNHGGSGADPVDYALSGLFATLIVLFAALAFSVRRNPKRRP